MIDEFLDRARQAARSARTLLAAGDPDGTVNRAYYAMFYAAHAALRQRGIEIDTSKHGTLVRRFGQHLVKPGLLPRPLGATLNKMLEMRQKADYGSETIASADAERAAGEAEAFIDAVERTIRG